jgi:hypothetical protein
MARFSIGPDSVAVWISARDSAAWARRPGHHWPCSDLAGHRIFAAFDRSGLLDVKIDGRDRDCPSHEFNAITADFLARKLPKDHPCYLVTVGQFREGN